MKDAKTTEADDAQAAKRLPAPAETPPPHTLTVNSTPVAGVEITGTFAGSTAFEVAMVGTGEVILTAPVQVVVGGDAYSFVRWVADGRAFEDGLDTIRLKVLADATATAEYVKSP